MTNLPLLQPVRITEEVLKTFNDDDLFHAIHKIEGGWFVRGLEIKQTKDDFSHVYLPLPEGREKEEMAKMIFNNIQGHSDSIALNIIEQHLDEYHASNIQKGEWNEYNNPPEDSGQIELYTMTGSHYIGYYSKNKKLYRVYGINGTILNDVEITHWRKLIAPHSLPSQEQK